MTISPDHLRPLTRKEAFVLRYRFERCGDQPRPEELAIIDSLCKWLDQACR